MRGRVNAIRTFKGLVADLRLRNYLTINDLYNAKISPLLYPIYRVNERKV